jgi:hypothetical protein
MMDEAYQWARTYAENRAAELVGMRRAEDGTLVPGNPRYSISETTRAGLRDLVEDALDEGLSTAELADLVSDSYFFSEARSTTIARTELAFSHVQGNMEGWRLSGVVGYKQSILGSEHDLDDICNDNAEVGPIPLDASFPSGDDGPPYHPNCVCDVIPILSEENDDSERT